MDGIPRGVEVLLRKASVDPPFLELLLADREGAARSIGLDLTPGERAVLAAASDEDVVRMAERTVVPEAHRATFRGRVAAAMLALVVGFGASGCAPTPAVTGIRKDVPPPAEKQDDDGGGGEKTPEDG